jgi:hypothetical protein
MAKTPKRPRDPNQLAKLIADIATGDAQIDATTTPNNRDKGGRIGAARRAENLTADERKHIAQKAAAARWANKI